MTPASANRIRVHFFGRQPGRAVSPLAGALGVGPLPRPEGVEARRFDVLAHTAPSQFEVVPPEAAQLWLFAHDLADPGELHAQLEILPQSARRRVFFYSNDDATPIAAPPDVTVFRTSLLGRSRLSHERAMPALCDDLIEDRGERTIERAWSDRPTIGFCGFVGSPLVRFGLAALGQQQKTDGLAVRELVLASLERSSSVRTDFVRRHQFWGGSMSRFHFSSNRQKDVRQEFVHNLLEADYTVCVRGKGNFSYRFYEVLAAGRIPVFLNTDCVLPFDDRIDWKRHVVWLEEREVDVAAQRVLAFHHALGPEGFTKLQRENRRLWKEWLSPEGFYPRALGELDT